MKVAVYTIALNEEQFVDAWYESAKEADYLLIADTGSTDKTVQKAKKLGINVINIVVRPWRFDLARNTALVSIPADVDYCVALDMDEILLPGWREELENAHKAGLTRPRYQYTWSWVDEEKGIPGLQYGGDKIHARFGYRWKHPVHEVITPDRIEEKQGWVGLEIHHHPDHSKSRSQYMPLLELAVREDPSDDRNTYYYARELFFHGRYNEAKQEFLRHLSLPKATWKPERAASMRYIAKCSERNEKEHWFKKAIDEAPDRREARVDLAEYYYQNKMWQECYDACQEILKIGTKPLEYLVEARAWGYLPYDYAAISAYYLGMKDVALELGKKALEFDPEDERLNKNLEFYKK